MATQLLPGLRAKASGKALCDSAGFRALEKDPSPGLLFEGNPVGEGTTRRGTATPVCIYISKSDEIGCIQGGMAVIWQPRMVWAPTTMVKAPPRPPRGLAAATWAGGASQKGRLYTLAAWLPIC